MTRISNYDELVSERIRIESIISNQKQVIKDDFEALKEKFEPFLYLLPLLNIFKQKSASHPLLNLGASLGIDLLVGQKLLSKSNWLLRLIVPLFLKKASSMVINGKKDQADVQ
jgi:hypothetical protein